MTAEAKRRRRRGESAAGEKKERRKKLTSPVSFDVFTLPESKCLVPPVAPVVGQMCASYTRPERSPRRTADDSAPVLHPGVRGGSVR